MPTILKSLAHALAVGSFLFSASQAFAGTETFFKPKQGGNRLDWCLDWSTGCGAPAANAWCKAKGFETATSFSQAPDIGLKHPTRLLSSGAVCDQGFCDGFAQITCASAGGTTFANPKQGGNRLDWCLSWSTGCGAPAATAWCKAKGFGSASSFTIAENIGASSPTRLLATGAVCDQGFCDGFAQITCEP
ncbi:MAG: hypothetical protein U1E16_15160 [Hyphomicrobiales bacterium]|uniref:hypothetical protein n=1 Tax=Aestuariivirga sp. TaxID=2650926 RepID=UPI0035AEE0FD